MNIGGEIVAILTTDGKVKETHRTTNTVMRAARQQMLLRITDSAVNASGARGILYMVVGSGNTAPTTAQTDLEDLIGSAQIDTVDDSGLTSAPPDRIYTYQFQSSEANGEVREVGMKYDDASLFSRAMFASGTVASASQADPVVIETNGTTGLASGQKVFIDTMPGANSSLNDRIFTVQSVETSFFTLTGEDQSGASAFTSGGRYVKNITKSSADVLEVNYTVLITV